MDVSIRATGRMASSMEKVNSLTLPMVSGVKVFGMTERESDGSMKLNSR